MCKVVHTSQCVWKPLFWVCIELCPSPFPVSWNDDITDKRSKRKGKSQNREGTRPWVFNERKFKTCKIINKALMIAGRCLLPFEDHVLGWKWRKGSSCVKDHGNLRVNCFCCCCFPYQSGFHGHSRFWWSNVSAPGPCPHLGFHSLWRSPVSRRKMKRFFVFNWKWVGKEPWAAGMLLFVWKISAIRNLMVPLDLS